MTKHIEFKTDVFRCARCKKNHTNVEFKPFTYKPTKYTHWAICPNNGEPILMKLIK